MKHFNSPLVLPKKTMANKEKHTAWILPVSYGYTQGIVTSILLGEPKALKTGTFTGVIKWLNNEMYVNNNKDIFDGRSGVVIFPANATLDEVTKYQMRVR